MRGEYMEAVMLEEFGGVENLKIKSIEFPQLDSNQILVKVEACGVCNHDLINRQGYFPRTKLPVVIGHEIAGVVEEIGSEVTDFNIGDRVVNLPSISCEVCKMCKSGRETLCVEKQLYGEGINGGYSEYVVGKDKSWVKIPDNISFIQGAIIACTVGTALHAINRAGLIAGETVLITGASGGIGVHAIQICRHLGAEVIAVTTSNENKNFLKKQGAHHVVTIKDDDVVSEVKRITLGKGVDVALEIVGEPTFKSTLRSMSLGGRMVLIGNTNASLVDMPPALLILKEIEIYGSSGCTKEELIHSLELVRNHVVTPVIEKTIPLNKVQESHKMLEGRQVKGRLILVPNVQA